MTQVVAGAEIEGVAQGRGGRVLFTEPGVTQVVVPLLIRSTPVVLDATPDKHRVYALALGAPEVFADVRLPATPLDGAIVTVKGDADHATGTPVTVTSEDGAIIDAGGVVSLDMPSGALGSVYGQARTFVYFAALGEWRVVWAFTGSGGIIPPPP